MMNTQEYSTAITYAFDKTISWLDRHREDFSLNHESEVLQRLLLLKPLGEFVLTLNIMLSHGLEYTKAMEHLEWAWNEVRQGDELFELISSRPDMIAFCGFYANLRHWGFRNERLDKLLTYLASTNSTQSLEMPIWQRIALHYNFWRLGMAEFPAECTNILWLKNEPEPWTICNQTAYAVTHNVFYITHFGLQRSRLSDRVADYLRIWLPAWTELYVEEQNWDITSELLMVAECIGKVPWFTDPMIWVMRMQGDDGYIPSPEGSGQAFVKATHAPERIMFLSNYHTTLVFLLAISLRLSKKMGI